MCCAGKCLRLQSRLIEPHCALREQRGLACSKALESTKRSKQKAVARAPITSTAGRFSKFFFSADRSVARTAKRNARSQQALLPPESIIYTRIARQSSRAAEQATSPTTRHGHLHELRSSRRPARPTSSSHGARRPGHGVSGRRGGHFRGRVPAHAGALRALLLHVRGGSHGRRLQGL